MADEVQFVERSPTVAEYQRLRCAVNWPKVDDAAVAAGLPGALYSVCAVQSGAVIGCGRVVGDGGIYFYLQDVVVLPQHQGTGLGRRITQLLMDFIARNARRNSFVGLMAAEGVAGFYRNFGFQERPETRPGMSRMWHPPPPPERPRGEPVGRIDPGDQSRYRTGRASPSTRLDTTCQYPRKGGHAPDHYLAWALNVPADAFRRARDPDRSVVER